MSAFNNQPTFNSSINSVVNFFETTSGFQRSNRFSVDITLPSSVSGTYRFFANAVQVPGQALIAYPDTMSPSGANIAVPLKRTYDERFIIEFIVDSNWEVRDMMESWINKMFVSNSTDGLNSSVVQYHDSSVGQIVIRALDQNSFNNRTITLYDAYPTTILPTQMMNETPNQYLTLTVDMNYRYYKIT